MNDKFDIAAAVIKIDEEIIFNDFIKFEDIAAEFLKATNVVMDETTALGLEVQLLRGKSIEHTSLRNGIEYNITANPKVGGVLEYKYKPTIKAPNCFFELHIYGDTWRGSTQDSQVIKIDSTNEQDAIDAIKKLYEFFNNEKLEYNSEYDIAKHDDPHADGNYPLIYKFYPYITYHSYGKMFITTIDDIITSLEK